MAGAADKLLLEPHMAFSQVVHHYSGHQDFYLVELTNWLLIFMLRKRTLNAYVDV